MEGSYFPEDKDLAHKIMMNLSNSDLVKICAMNKRMYDICNNYPLFWRNKFIKDYGEIAAEYKPENRSWKTHYMTVFIDLQKYKKNPVDFFSNILWKEDIDKSFYVDFKDKQVVPLKDAPEWVTNNLYLMKLDKVTVYLFNDFSRYKNITPIELLQKIPLSIYNSLAYVNGFWKSITYISPHYVSLKDVFTESR